MESQLWHLPIYSWYDIIILWYMIKLRNFYYFQENHQQRWNYSGLNSYDDNTLFAFNDNLDNNDRKALNSELKIYYGILYYIIMVVAWKNFSILLLLYIVCLAFSTNIFYYYSFSYFKSRLGSFNKGQSSRFPINANI